jgi:S-adenosylmethionine:tRNA ribosyltransferase-isomerase
VDVRAFDFDLPHELIAQEPAAERSASRLLHLHCATGGITHTSINTLPDVLAGGDLLVVNNTRVFPARLLGRRVPSGGAVECLLIQDLGSEGGRSPSRFWQALMHPGQKLRPGAQVVFEGTTTLRAEVLERQFHGRRVIRLWTDDGSSIDEAIDMIGHVPLPPYIKRDDRADDRDRYQTIFARARGSVAAPTAGLHFSRALLAALDARGIDIAEITLHVGYGTFQPVRGERVEDHRLEPEQYEIDDLATAAINRALEDGRRVIAVGSTTTRTLEAVALAHDGRIAAGRGSTDLFIYPGFQFRVIRGLLTNFHLPRSSLLMLVSAFAGRPSTRSGRPELVEGRERVLEAYREAIAERYRFYSYGDAMLML